MSENQGEKLDKSLSAVNAPRRAPDDRPAAPAGFVSLDTRLSCIDRGAAKIAAKGSRR
jgi:hypothetical protein